MTEQTQTGNPVFDFNAGFRKTAEKLQHRLLIIGITLLVGCGVAAIFADITERLRLATIIGTALGLALIASSLMWGFYWRKKLRDDFRNEFKI